MALYRSLAAEPLWWDLGDAGLRRVDPGEVLDVPDTWPGYLQTGLLGETPLLEPLDPPAPRRRTSTPQES